MSSLKRAAAEAFVSSEALQASPGIEANVAAEDASQDDVQPTTRLISKIQAVELLVKLTQFVPKEYSEGSAVAEPNASAGKNSDIGDIRIICQFKMRYLCRRFRNIIHRQTPLTLGCFFDRDGKYGVSLAERSGIRVSRHRSLDQLADLPKRFDSACEEQSERKAILMTDGICCAEIGSLYDSFMRAEHTLSMPALLYRLAEAAQGPWRLSLDLKTLYPDTLQSLIKDFDVPLKCQFPSLALAELKLGCGFRKAVRTVSGLVKHLLDFGQDSLVQLHINVYVLKSVFVAENGAMAALSDAWTCESLVELKLDVNDSYENFRDNDNRVALVAFCARLPRIFPGLRRIVFDGGNTHFDFSNIREFTKLVSVKMSTFFKERGYPTQEQCESLALLSSTSVSSLTLVAMENLLLKVDLVLPKLTTFKYVLGHSTDSFVAFNRQLETVNGSFEHLRELVLKLGGGELCSDFPSYAEFLQLLRSFHSLRELTSLRLQFGLNEGDDPDWCSPGHFSAIQILPETITNAHFIFALRPTAVEFDDDTDEYSLRCPPEVPRGEENLYKDWLRTLLVHISERPRLERFFCVCVAPRFEAILALAEKWNKSSVVAIAEVALTFVVHVQCTPVYTRMLQTGIPPARGDRMRFLFVLAPHQNVAHGPADKLAKPKRRMVTVEFKNVE